MARTLQQTSVLTATTDAEHTHNKNTTQTRYGTSPNGDLSWVIDDTAKTITFTRTVAYPDI